MPDHQYVKANRHFNSMRAGDAVYVDIEDPYWAGQLIAQNVSVVDFTPPLAEEPVQSEEAPLEVAEDDLIPVVYEDED